MKDNNISRRNFIKITAAGTAALTVAPNYLLSNNNSSLDPKGLPTRKFGRTGIEVPLIGMGCGSRFLSIDSLDKSDEVLNYALDNGIYYWDTAAAYAWDGKNSEERLGRVLKHRRKEVWLSTKLSERNGDDAMKQFEMSLKKLQTDYLNELKIHAVAEEDGDIKELVKPGGLYDVVSKLKEEGVVKNIGFSGHSSAEAMTRLVKEYDFDTMLIAMNHFQDGDEKFESKAVPAAAKKNMGIIAMKVVRPRESVKNIPADDLIRYALSLKHVCCAILGTDSLDILKKNIALIKNFKPLDKKRMEELQVSLSPFYQHRNVEWMQPGYHDGLWA